MRLYTEILEDPRGRRSAHAALYLHGPIPWPEDPVSALSTNPGRPVDQERRAPGASTRTLAQLDLLALDEFDDDDLAALLESVRQDLLPYSGAWILREGIAVRFLRADRAAAEQYAILTELLESARIRLRRRRLRTALRVLRLELTDFRGVDHLTLALSPNQTTVLVGANGAGKTTLLDAAVLLLAHFESKVAKLSERSRKLNDEDIMNGRAQTRVAVTAQIGENPVTWSLARARDNEPSPEEISSLFSLDEEVKGIHGEIERGDVCLPIAVYYSVNRAVLDIPLRIRTSHLFEPLEAYDRALAGGGHSFRLFFEWFRTREDLENENRARSLDYRDHQLEAVRRAITGVVPGVSELRVQRAPLGMVVTKGEWTLYVDQLSDGEKCLLAMVGDLARRLAMANPFADDPLKGGGVVLIDEIELHLYPAWQRHIVPALEKTFPNCQFIVSTHSPAVLGHVDHESIFLLKLEKSAISAVHPSVSKGMDVNRVLLEIMGVDERPHDVKVRLEAIYNLLGAGKLVEAREAIAALEGEIGSDPELVKAETIIRRKAVLGR